jgi:hypothetical protein
VGESLYLPPLPLVGEGWGEGAFPSKSTLSRPCGAHIYKKIHKLTP